MFGNHRGHGRHGHHGGHRGPGSRGDGGEHLGARGRERMFEHGELRTLVLSLLQERPRHGYEIIRAIEELTGGDYTPSPGVIYPTLTLLEELGQTTVTLEQAGKKQYGITAQGAAVLASDGEALKRIRERLESAASVAGARRAPELQRSIQNFKTALHLRLSRGPLTPEALHGIADAIDRAAVEIERG